MTRASCKETKEQLTELLGESVYRALGLRDCLIDERAALDGRDANELLAAVDAKHQCISLLRDLEKERARISAAAGFGEHAGNMQDLIDWCDDDSVVANCWQHLLSIADRCNDLNMRNGAIVRMRKQQIDSSLSVIRGKDPGTETYGRNGIENSGAGQHSLAEA